MNARTVEVLHSIVVAYIETGEPVASKNVVLKKAPHRGESALSPATIRNIMAELTEEGYLAQPHTSAGRIPTRKAFQHYIESLATGRLVNAELDRIRGELRRAQTVGGQLERSSAVLSDLTRGVGIAAAIPAATQRLEQVELLLLSDRRVLMIVVTGDRMVRQQVVALDSNKKVTQDDLTSIRNYINRNFGGWVLDDVRRELESRLEEERATYDAILKTLTSLYNQGLLDFGLEPEIHFDGASNLVGLDVKLTSDTLRELLAALEEKRRILALLDRFLEEPSGQIATQIGLGEIHPSLEDVALIGVTVSLPDGMSTKLAVLGPLRMNYNRAISAIRHVGQALDGLDR